MFNKNYFIIFNTVALFLLCLFSCKLQNVSFAANFPLEIIQPQAGLNTLNRFYKAYPGLPFEVRAAVIGGAYPYRYSLATGPAGMTIDQNTGTITWSNPVTAGSPFNITIRVTDSENVTVSRSWSLTVTTAGFRFIDAVNGRSAASGGTGTLSNPWRTMNDFYRGSKSDSTYSGEFIYWRSGTYYVDAYIEDSSRTPFVANYKPTVWLAYPGESPVIDFQKSSQHSFIFYTGNNNIYLEGLEIRNIYSHAIQINSNQPGMVFRKMKMHDLGPTSGSNNQSFFRILATGQGNYLTIQECELYNLNHGAAMKFYQTNKMLIEDNYVHDIIDTVGGSLEGIALKQDVTRATIRHNRVYNVPARGIAGNMNSEDWTFQDNEYLYNRVWGCTSNAIEVNQKIVSNAIGRHYYYRNTFECPVTVHDSLTTDGPFYFTDNVIQASSPQINGDISRIVESGNIKGTSGVVDANGNLTSGYSNYVGSKGWQLGSQSSYATTPTLSIINYQR